MLERDSYVEMFKGLNINEDKFVKWGVKEVVELLPDVEEVEAEWEELKERIFLTKDELKDELISKIDDTIIVTIRDEIKNKVNKSKQVTDKFKALINDIYKNSDKIKLTTKLKKDFPEIQSTIEDTNKKLKGWSEILTKIEEEVKKTKPDTTKIEKLVNKIINGIYKNGQQIEFDKLEDDFTKLEHKIEDENKKFSAIREEIINQYKTYIENNIKGIENPNIKEISSYWKNLRNEIYNNGTIIDCSEELKNNFTELEKKVNENGKFSGTKGIIKSYKSSIENKIKDIENSNIKDFPQNWNKLNVEWEKFKDDCEKLKGEWKELKDEINYDEYIYLYMGNIDEKWNKIQEKIKLNSVRDRIISEMEKIIIPPTIKKKEFNEQYKKLKNLYKKITNSKTPKYVSNLENIKTTLNITDREEYLNKFKKEYIKNVTNTDNLKKEIEKNLYPQIDTEKMLEYWKKLTENDSSFTDIRENWNKLKKELNQINNSDIKEWNELKKNIENKSYQDLIEIEKRLRYLMNKIDNPIFYIRSYGNRASEDAKQNGEKIKELYQEALDLEIKFDKDGNKNPNVVMGKINQKYKKEKQLKEGDKCKVLRNCKLSHIWGFTHNVFLFNSPWNIMFTPSVIDPLTGHETHNSELKKLFKEKMSKIIFEKYRDLIKEYNELPERRKMYDLIEKHKEDGQVYEDMLKEWDEINDKNIFENVKDDSD